MTHLDQTAVSLLNALGSAAIKASLLLTLAAVATLMLRRRSAALRHLIWTIGLGGTVALLMLPTALPAWRVLPLADVSFSPGGQARLTASGARPPLSADTASGARPPLSVDTASGARPPLSVDTASGARPPLSVDTAGGARSPLSVDTTGGARPPLSVDTASGARSPLSVDTTPTPDTPATPAPVATAHWPSLLSWLTALTGLAGLWLIGVSVVFTRYVWSIVVLHRLCRSAVPVGEADGGPLARAIASSLRITRSISVLRSEDVELPLTWGIVRPRVVLPGDSSEWTTERLQYVLQHELAHVTRLDACTQLVAGAASALFWFHPLVWYAASRMRHERERACDDHVLAQGAVASAYAGDLLSLVRTYGHLDRHEAALAMAHRSQFEGRLLALLDPAVERAGVSSRHVALVSIVAAVLVIPAAAMQGARTSSAPLSPASLSLMPIGTPLTTDVAAPALLTTTPVPRASLQPSTRPASPVPAAPATQADASDLFAGCSAGPSTHDQHATDGRTLWTATARTGACSYALTAHGEVLFSRDFTGLDGIQGGGDIDITTNIRGDVTHLIGRSTGAGMTYEFSRNGRTTDFTPDGPPWLAAFLVTFDRETAFAVDRRVPLLLQAGGTAAVLDEVDRMHSDHAKSLYLTRLIRTTPLDAGALAGATGAAVRMTIDHEVALILTSLAARRGLPDASVHTMLDAASRMQVDHNKLEVLLALADNDRITGAYTSEYLSIADTLQSPNERRRALAALSRR